MVVYKTKHKKSLTCLSVQLHKQNWEVKSGFPVSSGISGLAVI